MYKTGIRTKAKVVGYTMKSVGEDDHWLPMLKFKDEQKKTVFHTMSEGATWKKYALNKQVNIRYERAHPNNLIITEIDWKTTIFLIIVAAVLTITAILNWHRF